MSKLLLSLVSTAGFLVACGETPDDPHVDPPVDPVDAVEVEAARHDLHPGELVQLTARAFDADGAPVTGRAFRWESSDAAVATVNDLGLVTAIADGEVTIYATTGFITGGLYLTVTELDPPVPVDHITIDHTEIVLPLYRSIVLVAQPRDALGEPLARTVTWSSDAPDHISVDEHGVVTALEVGGAEITATSEGQRASVLVYATATTDHTLVALDGRALPTMLGTFTETHPDGSTSTRGVRIYDGWLTIDHESQTYAATIRGTYTTASQMFWVPIPITYQSTGAVDESPTGDLVFTPDAGTPFTGRWTAVGVELHWQLDGRIAGASTLELTID